MTNVVANRFVVAARAAQALAISAICGGGAALYWNRVYFCGSGLRQLIWPNEVPGCEPVSPNACILRVGVPYCHSQLHTIGTGVSLIALGVVLYWLARQALCAVNTRGNREAVTWLIWGAGIALFGVAIVPIQNFAVVFSEFQAANGHPGGLSHHVRMTRLPGTLFAAAGLVLAALSWRRAVRARNARKF